LIKNGEFKLIGKIKTGKTKLQMLTLLGIPFDDYSSFLNGAAEAPQKIREALFSESTNTFSENGTDIGSSEVFTDAGDIKFNDNSEKYRQIEDAVLKLMENKTRVLSLGGDHSITYPIIKVLSSKYPRLNILHFDAHPDLYDEFQGNRCSHACPFARIMEDNLADKLVQVGIRTTNNHQRRQAEKFDVDIMDLHASADEVVSKLEGPLYISLDMDVLDPAFAPGISHYEPGGLSTRQVLDIIQRIEVEIVGADIVEYNPRRDINGITAMTAAKFVKEIGSKMIVSF
jgi:agmatinase